MPATFLLKSECFTYFLRHNRGQNFRLETLGLRPMPGRLNIIEIFKVVI